MSSLFQIPKRRSSLSLVVVEGIDGLIGEEEKGARGGQCDSVHHIVLIVIR